MNDFANKQFSQHSDPNPNNMFNRLSFLRRVGVGGAAATLVPNVSPSGDDAPQVNVKDSTKQPGHIDPNWTVDNQTILFSELISRAKANSEIAERCLRSPADAKQVAQEIADELGMNLRIPEREVVVLIAERRAEYCHVYSLKPKKDSPINAEFNLDDHLVGCYLPWK